MRVSVCVGVIRGSDLLIRSTYALCVEGGESSTNMGPGMFTSIKFKREVMQY